LMYRKNTWWYVSYSLLRRLIVIGVASIPLSNAEVTSTFLAVVVGIILAVQLFIMPMTYRSTNMGEAFVWLIALAITLFNIKLEAPQLFQNIVSGLALALFSLVPYFIYLLVLDKISYIPTLDSKEAKKEIDLDEVAKTNSPRSTSIHKSGIMLDDDGRITYDLPFGKKLTLLKKAPAEAGELPRGAIYTDTIEMAAAMRDKFVKRHRFFSIAKAPKRAPKKKESNC